MVSKIGKNTTVRFLHIPKTAGSTLTSVLYRKYLRHNSFCFTGSPSQDMARYNSLTAKQRSQIRLFVGHAPIVTGIKAADSAYTITLLRDPVARVKSFCQHVYEGKSPHLVQRFPPFRHFDLTDFLQNAPPDIFNLQTKMLVNHLECAAPSVLTKMSSQAAVDLALQNLQSKVHTFGIQEMFDESMLHFAQQFGWGVPFYATKNAKQKDRPLLFKQHHLEQIIAQNQLDMQVYQTAKKLFVTQRTMRPRALSVLQITNRVTAKVVHLFDLLIHQQKNKTTQRTYSGSHGPSHG